LTHDTQTCRIKDEYESTHLPLQEKSCREFCLLHCERWMESALTNPPTMVDVWDGKTWVRANPVRWGAWGAWRGGEPGITIELGNNNWRYQSEGNGRVSWYGSRDWSAPPLPPDAPPKIKGRWRVETRTLVDILCRFLRENPTGWFIVKHN